MPITYDFTNGDDHYNAKYAGDFRLHMLDGNDWLRVTAGNVTATMGNGDDCVRIDSGQLGVFGQAGNDWFAQYGGILHTDGGDGNDRFVLYGGRGTMDGGLGNDRFDIRADGLTVNLLGGSGDDRFVGYGHHVSGTVSGGDGNDGFVGFTSGVTLAGGTGDDTYVIDPASQPSIVENNGGGRDTVILNGGGSYTLPDNVENLTLHEPASGEWAYNVVGNDTGNVIRGSAGADTIYSGNGNDVLLGGAGNDYLDSFGGNDMIVGGPGIDQMIGGDGVDRFVFWTGDSPEDPTHAYVFDAYSDMVDTDLINSFETSDIIDLSNIDANTEVAGMQRFTLVSDGSTAAGTLHWTVDSIGVAHIYGYTDSDATPDVQIAVNSFSYATLTAANFFLGG